MLNPFAWLDGILLGAAQKFCDKAQRLTGLTKFTFEKSVIIASAVFFWGDFFFSSDVRLVVVVLPYTLLIWYATRRIGEEESEFLASAKIHLSALHAATVRLTIACIFASLIGMSLWTLGRDALLMSCGYISYIIWVYIAACIPRPPSKSKIREWFNKVLWRLDDMLQPAPASASN